MTTSATIDAAWLAAIWASPTIQAITSKVFQYNIVQDSDTEIAQFYQDGEVNCFIALTTLAARYVGANTTSTEIQVVVDYYRQKDASGAHWTEARDVMETLYALVISALGFTWSGTVAFWQGQEKPPEIAETDIKGVKCWRSRFVFTATI
jgi:hypothetical protein